MNFEIIPTVLFGYSETLCVIAQNALHRFYNVACSL